jgi:hypothetical protein
MLVQSLWIGDKLSNLEILTINSFIKNNIDFDLYTYKPIINLPNKVNIKNANEILPENQIFCYQVGKGKGSFSAFSNIFRYKLLYDKGGIWVDMDLVCLTNFSIVNEYTFASELNVQNKSLVASCFIKAPKNSEIFKWAYEKSISYDKNTLEWSIIGPTLLSKAITKFKLNKYIKNYKIFCPIGFKNWKLFIEPNKNKNINLNNSYCVHLWNEKWRRGGINKNDIFDKNTLYEQLKIKYFI